MTLFEALSGGAFDGLNWLHSGEFDQNFSKKSNARGFARGGRGMGGFGIDRYIIAASLQSDANRVRSIPRHATLQPQEKKSAKTDRIPFVHSSRLNSCVANVTQYER